MRYFCFALVLATLPTALADARDAAVEGFALHRHRPPDWNWGARPPVGGVAQTNVAPDGSCTVTFTVGERDLPGLDASRVRFGIATGPMADGPTLWLEQGHGVTHSGDIPPLDGMVLGGATLISARLGRASGNLVAELVFATPPALESPWDLMGLIDADGEAATGYHGAEWLLQNVALNAEPPPGLSVPWLEARPGIVLRRQPAQVVAWVVNDGPETAQAVRARLTTARAACRIEPDNPRPFALRPGETRRCTWTVEAAEAGPLALRLEVTSGGRHLQRTRWITVVDERDPRHEFRSQTGDWLRYPERPTLQAGNAAPLRAIAVRPSSELKRNRFGITTHLPRTVDDEEPFIAAHAIDGDPATCWASRWWRIAVPFEPEWLQVDLGRVRRVVEVRFLPAWRSSGVPAGLVLQTSSDARLWATVAEQPDHQAPPAGSVPEWETFRFAPRQARYVRLTATRLNQGATSFFCAPFEPFQFRVAELETIDEAGAPIHPVAATASTTHHAWYNDPQTTTQTWPLLAESGVKLNRIGQWGDRTDWATVEKAKGQYRIPDEVDRAIRESHAVGVETLLTLAYGNSLYQQVGSAPDFGPTWLRAHPFMQCAPTTPEAVEGFARYCAFMARHFRGRVKYFEIWNEENGWFFDDWARVSHVSQVRAYGRALKAAAEAVKEANPEAIVIFGGTAGSTLDYPRIALEEGAGPLIDVFAFHPYGHPTPESAPDNFLVLVGENMEWRPRPEAIRTYEDEIAAMRELLHQYNPRMQIWADEMNWFAPGEPPRTDLGDQGELAQAKHLSRFFALNAWLECGAVWWSMYNANGVQEWAVVRSSDMSPRAAYYAAQYASTVLDDVRPAPDVRPEVFVDTPDDLLVKPFRNGRGELLIGLWRTTPAVDACHAEPVTLRLPGVRDRRVELLDLIYGTRQPARIEPDGTLRDLLVGDWPLVVRVR